MCRDPARLLDPVEETFDPVAGSVEMGAEADWIFAITFWRNVGPRALLHGEFSDSIGVVATVGDQH
jgi:hypothetical protein